LVKDEIAVAINATLRFYSLSGSSNLHLHIFDGERGGFNFQIFSQMASKFVERFKQNAQM